MAILEHEIVSDWLKGLRIRNGLGHLHVLEMANQIWQILANQSSL